MTLIRCHALTYGRMQRKTGKSSEAGTDVSEKGLARREGVKSEENEGQ